MNCMIIISHSCSALPVRRGRSTRNSPTQDAPPFWSKMSKQRGLQRNSAQRIVVNEGQGDVSARMSTM